MGRTSAACAVEDLHRPTRWEDQVVVLPAPFMYPEASKTSRSMKTPKNDPNSRPPWQDRATADPAIGAPKLILPWTNCMRHFRMLEQKCCAQLAIPRTCCWTMFLHSKNLLFVQTTNLLCLQKIKPVESAEEKPVVSAEDKPVVEEKPAEDKTC